MNDNIGLNDLGLGPRLHLSPHASPRLHLSPPASSPPPHPPSPPPHSFGVMLWELFHRWVGGGGGGEAPECAIPYRRLALPPFRPLFGPKRIQAIRFCVWGTIWPVSGLDGPLLPSHVFAIDPFSAICNGFPIHVGPNSFKNRRQCDSTVVSRSGILKACNNKTMQLWGDAVLLTMQLGGFGSCSAAGPRGWPAHTGGLGLPGYGSPAQHPPS